MFNRKSIYALNKKDPNAIVYLDADGNLIRLTRDCFACEEEFLRWKAWSDENFHSEDKRDVAEDKHSVSLDGLSEEALAISGADVVIEQHHDRTEQRNQAANMVIRLKDRLTETQFRRLWMYCVDGKTEQEIAVMENVDQQRVSKSILAAKKKIKKFCSNS